MSPPKNSSGGAGLTTDRSSPAPVETAAIKRKQLVPQIPKRRLRVYALDPSLAKMFDCVAVNETVLSIPWDDCPATDHPLAPGPVGEYLEVVDVDPASDRVYGPVDLNDKALLAQDGWPPSEGNPKFHQQMVYAVAMTTNGHFERALGRRALWAARRATIAPGGWRSPSDGRTRWVTTAVRTRHSR